jgi:hypothetical protein
LFFHHFALFEDDPLPVPDQQRGKGIRPMTFLGTSITSGLVALSLAGALLATAPAAEARDHHRHDDILAGVAAGLAGGLIGGAIASQSRGPVYEDGPVYDDGPAYDVPPPPRHAMYERSYYRPAPAPHCHYEWRDNGWGEAFRVRVCPQY